MGVPTVMRQHGQDLYHDVDYTFVTFMLHSQVVCLRWRVRRGVSVAMGIHEGVTCIMSVPGHRYNTAEACTRARESFRVAVMCHLNRDVDFIYVHL